MGSFDSVRLSPHCAQDDSLHRGRSQVTKLRWRAARFPAVCSTLLSFDSEIVATSFGIPNVKVFHVDAFEQSLDRRVYLSVVHILLREQAPAFSVGRQRQPMRSQVGRKASIIRKSLASAGMNENRPRQRQRLDPIKGIVGKQNSPVLANLKVAEAMPTRPVPRRHFHVRGMSIAWRPHTRANQISYLRWNRRDPKCL
jgi:hypothetical protein